MSTIQASPFVNFHGRAREAMEFYQKVLGGKLDFETGPGDRVRQARLDTGGTAIIGTDGHPKYAPTFGDNMAIALGGTDRERIIRVFSGLAEGGRINGQLTAQPGGGEVGYLVDRFGINWIVTVEKA